MLTLLTPTNDCFCKSFDVPILPKQISLKFSLILAETQLDPQYLELEITESVAMHADTATIVLQELRKLRVKVAIDDFGTGYSSLSYLKRFPIDHLKID